VSTVGWNVLGLQLVGVALYKDKCSLLLLLLSLYQCIPLCNYLSLTKSLEHACFPDITVHVVNSVVLCILNK
jgi:hypothetical protein